MNHKIISSGKIVVGPAPLGQEGEFQIDPDTRFIYSTSGSSTSQALHTEGLQRIRANIVYQTDSSPVTAEAYATRLRDRFVLGGAVTGQGLKEGIIRFLDVVDPFAERLRSVNTVVNRDGKLYGYNTDAVGLQSALKDRIKTSQPQIQTAVIYGNGGVSGVAYYVLKEMGMRVTMVGRNPNRVDAKRELLGIEHFDGPYDLVINATPVSASPLKNAVLLPQLLKECVLVFDHSMPERDGKINYLAQWCAENNRQFIPGTAMFGAQKEAQLSLFLCHLIRPDGTPWIDRTEIASIFRS